MVPQDRMVALPTSNPVYRRPAHTLSRRRFLATAGGIAAAGILAACGGTAATQTPRPPTPTTQAPPAATPTPATSAAPAPAGTASAGSSVYGQALAVTAVEYAFQTVGSLPAGLTTIQLKNLGREPHYAHFFRLNEGVTTDQYLAALKSDLPTKRADASGPLAIQVGGPSTVSPGGMNAVIQTLQPGQYVIACFIPNDKGMPHAALGMVLPLTVAAAAGPPTQEPAVNGTITLTDAGFELPGALPAGRSLYRVVNRGSAAQEFSLIGIAPGKTRDDVKAYFYGPPAGPPPFTNVAAGIAGLGTDQSGIAILDLVRGDYAVFMSDPGQGTIRGLTVA